MRWVGLVAGVSLIIACFYPWVVIESTHGKILVTGIESTGTSYGKPGYFHFFLAACFLLFNFVPRIWAKRLNILVSSINVAWAIRNYFLISACAGGDCPEKRAALYVMLISSIVMLVAALLPRLDTNGRT